MRPWTTNQGDTGKPLVLDLTYEDDDLVLDIPAGTTCKFSMSPEADRATTIVDDADAAVDASAGGVVTVRFAGWQPAHVATPGRYLGEFHFPTLNISAPTNQPYPITIRRRTGDTP